MKQKSCVFEEDGHEKKKKMKIVTVYTEVVVL